MNQVKPKVITQVKSPFLIKYISISKHKFQLAHLTLQGKKNVIPNLDKSQVCNDFYIFYTRIKSSYSAKIYNLCLECYNRICILNDIVRLTVMAVNRANDNLEEDVNELLIVRCYETILRWLRVYYDNGDDFVNPSLSRLHCHKKSPKFLYKILLLSTLFFPPVETTLKGIMLIWCMTLF